MTGSAAMTGPFWTDGMTWTALASRQVLGGVSTADTGTASAVHPHNGVFAGLTTSLQVTAGTGMTVKVGAGFCAIRHPTTGQGAYLTGLMSQATLTVATADPTNPRLDLVCARVYDLGSSSSYADVEIIAGTPASSPVLPATPSAAIALGQVAVAAGASAPGAITDKRAWTAAPGGIIPVANAAAAPAVAAWQVLYNQATGQLCRGSGTAGTVLAVTSSQPPALSAVNTSTGATGLTPGTGGSGTVPWGIGYGRLGSYFSTDGTAAQEIQVTWTANGTSDYEIAYKWQLAFCAAKWLGHTGVSAGHLTYQLSVDGAVVDTVTQYVTDTKPAPGGTASWFTSALAGTRPARGAHTATLSVVTASTHTSTDSGVMIGDLNDSAHSVFGTTTGWAAALTAENCYVAVIPVPPA